MPFGLWAAAPFKGSFERCAVAETKVLYAFMQSSQSAKPVILGGPIMTQPLHLLHGGDEQGKTLTLNK